MKHTQINISGLVVPALVMLLLSACSLFDLNLQKNYNRKPHPIDSHLYKTTWDYLKARSTGNNQDTIFKFMYDGIIYCGIDTNEYKEAGRTFILLHNDAIKRIVKNVVQPDCFFGANLVNGKPGTKWSDYPKETVKNYLSYLLLAGEFTHVKNLSTSDTLVQTLAPRGIYPGNSRSVMGLRILDASLSNTVDYPIQINDSVSVRTSDLLSTNGVVQVVDRYINPNFQ
ncbi:MAG: hypothetical protein EPN37_07760 [Chitinophagaceae bacterium]|nr:MAG: hypothetical protein EPN37_07760 [Chitinophagaceae bacterium]